MKQVSVIIPVYNSEKYLNRCVESILNQTFTDFELILINDGSTDKSEEIIKQFLNKDNRVKLISQENHGIAKTRNNGIKIAEGKYIVFIDNDDYVRSDYLEKLFFCISENALDIVYSGYTRIDTTGKKFDETKLSSKNTWNRFRIIAPWAKIYKTSFLKDNDITFLDSNIGEDIYFNLNIIDKTEKFLIIDYIGYYWFYNDESVSNTIHRKSIKNLQFNYLLNQTYGILKNEDHNEEYEYFFIKTICWFLLYSTKGASVDEVDIEINNCFNWLKLHYPNYRYNKRINLFYLKDEKFKNIFFVYMVVLLYKLKLLNKLIKIYSRS